MARNIFPKGIPLTVAINLTKPDGSAFNLAGYSCQLFYGVGSRWAEVPSVTVSGNVISWSYAAGDQAMIGDYKLRLIMYQNDELFCTINFNKAFSLYNQRGVYTPQEEQDEVESNIVTLFSVAEYYLFRPIIPTIGDDGYWYVNGTQVTDSHGNYINAEHTIRYDSDTKTIIIDEGRVDAEGNSIQQDITDIASALTAFGDLYEAAEGTSGSTAGDGSRWGAYKTAEAARDSAMAAAEGSTGSTAGDGSRWGAYKTAEAAREETFAQDSAEAIAAANDAAEHAEHAASLVPLQVLQDCEEATAAANAAGITEVHATVDANVGTPSIDATLLNKVLTLALHNMKGNTGATPNITVGSVETGEPGTNVVVTITGTPENPVLNITIPRGNTGAQGNSGYQGAAGELEIVNNIKDGGAAKGLSAEQGKEIGKALYNFIEQGSISNVIGSNGAWTNSYTGRYVKVPKGSVVIISAGSNNSYYSRLRSIDTSQSPDFVSGQRITVSSGGYNYWIATEDCYIVWYYSSYAPSSVLINGNEYVDLEGPVLLKTTLLNNDVDKIIKDHYDFYTQGEVGCYPNGSGGWNTSSGVRSRYVYAPKGTQVTVNGNSSGKSYYFLVAGFNTSSDPVFKSGTNGIIEVAKNGSSTRTLTEDCYIGWYYSSNKPDSVMIGGSDYVDAAGPKVPIVKRLYADIETNKSNISTLNTTINSSIYFDKENGVVNKYMGDSGWSSNAGKSRWVKIQAGDIIHIIANASYSSQVSCVADVSASTPVFKNGFSGRKQGRALSFVASEEGYLLVLIETGSSDYTPAVFEINGRDYRNGSDGRTASKYLSDEIELLKNNNREDYANDVSKYFLKGAAQKSFSKKICILAAGQSNIDGRVPVENMPSEISAAMPIENCHYSKNSSSGSFSSLNITTGEWAFDLVTYYNLVTRANQEIYVIKWSEGGTSIDPLGDGGNNHRHWTADYEQLSNTDYSLLRKFETSIRAKIAAAGDQFEIRAMLWHQGEGDRALMETGCEMRYLDNMRNLIAYVRGIVGNAKLPIILGTVSWRSTQFDRMVDWSIRKIASEDPYVYLIDMNSATLLDSYHFDAASSEYFGKKAYDALIDAGVINGTKINPTAPWETT